MPSGRFESPTGIPKGRSLEPQNASMWRSQVLIEFLYTFGHHLRAGLYGISVEIPFDVALFSRRYVASVRTLHTDGSGDACANPIGNGLLQTAAKVAKFGSVR